MSKRVDNEYCSKCKETDQENGECVYCGNEMSDRRED